MKHNKERFLDAFNNALDDNNRHVDNSDFYSRTRDAEYRRIFMRLDPRFLQISLDKVLLLDSRCNCRSDANHRSILVDLGGREVKMCPIVLMIKWTRLKLIFDVSVDFDPEDILKMAQYS